MMMCEIQSVSEEAYDQVGNLSFSPPPMKHSDTRDSISSIDSDVSLSYDRLPGPASPGRRPSDETANLADLSDSASDAGSAGGKDSGCEVNAEPITRCEPPFTPPSNELCEKIVSQVEFYFSDVNITKDAFLLKHVKRNKEGYVSLKLISSFKRVKHLTKDWRVVATALLRSKKLEINEAGTKLRRTEPLPPYDQTTPSRTIVAVDMPIEKPTIENVAELFSTCGEIALIRVLRPGNPVPADVRQFINKNPSLAGAVCALVEYTDSESARAAVRMQETMVPMRVFELNNLPSHNHHGNDQQRKKRTSQHKMTNIQKIAAESEGLSSCASGSEAEMCSGDLRTRRLPRRSSSHFPARTTDPGAWLQRRFSAASVSSNSDYSQFTPRRLSTASSNSGSEAYLTRRFSNCSISSDYGSAGPASRRTSTSSTRDSDYCPTRSRASSNASFVMHLPDNVVRMPQGPDGSRGFRQRLINPYH